MRELIRQKIIDSSHTVLPAFTRRDVYIPEIKNKAYAVIGMRRTGKTTFLWQLLSDRLNQGMRREGLLYFNFEDERLSEMATTDLQVIVEEYYALYPERRDQKISVFFLDEIQAVSGWESFVRRLLDTERVELFISGSSARLLSREIATSMRGRALEIIIHPFSFREYLRHRGYEPGIPVSHLPKADKSVLTNQFLEYLNSGGFPEAQRIEARDRFELFRSYIDVSLFRDVVERYQVTHPVALRWMIRQLLSNAGGHFSANKFYQELRSQGFALSKDTVHEYLSYLEDAFLIRVVALATDSERRRMVNTRKVYPIDPGFIPMFDRSGRLNLGHALETSILLQLERMGASVAYVRTAQGHEVDFLAIFPDGKQELIQVCAELDKSSTKEREIRSLLQAAQEYPRATLHIISLYTELSLTVPEPVRLHSALSWLLDHE